MKNKTFVAQTRLANQEKKSSLSVLVSRTSYFHEVASILNSSVIFTGTSQDKDRLGLDSLVNLDEIELNKKDTMIANPYSREYENKFNFPIQIPILKFKKTDHSFSRVSSERATNTSSTPLLITKEKKITNTTSNLFFHPNNANISNLSILLMLNLIPLEKQSKILFNCANSNINLFKNIDLYNEHINNNLKFFLLKNIFII